MPLRLAFEIFGTGPPVVILHGLLASGRNWQAIARELAASHQVFCVDLRNHGHSPWAATMEYGEMADDVRMLIETEKLDRPIIIGHGMGGKAAMAMALASPGSLGSLIVVDIAPVSYSDRLLPYFQAIKGFDIHSAKQRALALQRMSEEMPDSAAVSFLKEVVAEPNNHFDERLNLEVIAASVTTLCEFPPELLLHSCTVPTRLIVGARSDRIQPTHMAAIAEAFPLLQVVTIDDAGHWVQSDRPEQFLAALGLT